MEQSRLEELLSGALDEQLSQDEQRELAAELEACAEARALQAAWQADRDALRALPRIPAPPELAARIALRSRRERNNSYLRRGLGLAARLLLVSWLLVGRATRPGLPLDQVATLEGAYQGGSTRLSLSLDAGRQPGSRASVKVSYDFNGDGTWDHSVQSASFPLDSQEGWERVEVELAHVDGLQDFRGGRLQVELVDAPGVRLNASESYVRLPHEM